MPAPPPNAANLNDEFGPYDATSNDVEAEGENGERISAKEVTISNIDDAQIKAIMPVVRALFHHDVLRAYRWCDDALVLTFERGKEGE